MCWLVGLFVCLFEGFYFQNLPSRNFCSSWGRQINNKIHRVPKALWAMEKNKAIKGRIENKGKDVMREHWQERGKDGPL